MTDVVNVINQIGNQCTGNCCNHVGLVSVNDICNGVKLLKPDKKDGSLNLSTNHLIHGTSRLFTLLSLLFSSRLIHGYVPCSMLSGTMVPIPKIQGTSNSDKFRAITMSNIFTIKLLDQIILEKV